VLLFDVAALGAASLLQSGSASRLLMAAAIVNPVDAVRTGVLMALEGTTAFGGRLARVSALHRRDVFGICLAWRVDRRLDRDSVRGGGDQVRRAEI
jgi:hypothetical protein